MPISTAGIHQSGAGIRNCTKPLKGIKLDIKVDNHDYQKNQIPSFDIRPQFK